VFRARVRRGPTPLGGYRSCGAGAGASAKAVFQVLLSFSIYFTKQFDIVY
jgi:hypothetical protein